MKINAALAADLAKIRARREAARALALELIELAAQHCAGPDAPDYLREARSCFQQERNENAAAWGARSLEASLGEAHPTTIAAANAARAFFPYGTAII